MRGGTMLPELGFAAASVVALLSLTVTPITTAEAHLQVGYYQSSCPAAELIVKQTVMDAIADDPGVGADLLRMHFHDCFVSGCDASILLNSTEENMAEKDAEVNSTFEGFEIIDAAKEKLEAACKGVVSCADIIAFAARDSVVNYGGFHYEVPAGRRDGKTSMMEDTKVLPSTDLDLGQLTHLFVSKGFSQSEMIVLSGAHTVGISHCGAFSGRLYGSANQAAEDGGGWGSMDEVYAAKLKAKCPMGSNETVPMDPHSQLKFDTRYYKNLLRRRGLFGSDQTLVSTQGTRTQVKHLARNRNRFRRKFAEVMVKLGTTDVLTGADGEVRANCRMVNS